MNSVKSIKNISDSSIDKQRTSVKSKPDNIIKTTAQIGSSTITSERNQQSFSKKQLTANRVKHFLYGSRLTQTENTLTLHIKDAQIILQMNSDITKQASDFIVNAANEKMLGGGGVDGAISQAGGPELLYFRTQVPDIRGVRCPVGDAKLTDAGRLPASFCIHAVGPRYDEHQSKTCRNQLLSAYESSLNVAHEWIESLRSNSPLPISITTEKNIPNDTYSPEFIAAANELQENHVNNLKNKIQNNEPISISLPTISTGIFDYPKKEGASIAIKALLNYINNHEGKFGIKIFKFIFLKNQKDLPFYKSLFQEIHTKKT